MFQLLRFGQMRNFDLLLIQAWYRGFQVRRQYRKFIWSVGVLEKAILRWRQRRKGLRGLEVEIKEPDEDQRRESDTEEDFYRASRKQAEERVENAVVRVQSMFRSKQAQKEYRRMKLAHTQAQVGRISTHFPNTSSVSKRITTFFFYALTLNFEI